MNIGARMQPESPEKAKTRDLSPWVVAAITIIVYVVTVAGTFASVKTTVEEQQQQIKELRHNSVSRQEMDDVKEWLKRIDGKLDKALEKR
jgi:ABC-type phosphate/phosphonate transport system substrate-binding protein